MIYNLIFWRMIFCCFFCLHFCFLWDMSTSFVKLEKHTVRSDTFCCNVHRDERNFFFPFFYPLLFLLGFLIFFFIFDPETETYDLMFLGVCSEKRMLYGLASCLSVRNCDFGYTHTVDFVCKLRFVWTAVSVRLCRGPIHRGCFHSRIQKVCFFLRCHYYLRQILFDPIEFLAMHSQKKLWKLSQKWQWWVGDLFWCRRFPFWFWATEVVCLCLL